MKEAQSLWQNAPRINKDAIFIADSHFMPLHLQPLPEQGEVASKALLDYFKTLLKNPAQIPSQIFLMGDITHLLLGGVKSSVDTHKELLDSICTLSQVSQVWWFEGNHDFGLNALQKRAEFSKIYFIPRSKQPLAFSYINESASHLESTKESQNVLLAHGDLFLNKKYELYIRCMQTKIMRWLLALLDSVTFGNLYASIAKKVNHNTIRQGKTDIESFAKKRICAYNTYLQNAIKKAQALADEQIDMIIEGHFHIGKAYKGESLYISLPSFYLTRSIFSIESATSNEAKSTIQSTKESD
ncbi:metallophosphoesterase [Helicobacter cinaedi]|uniref:Metallophosphoesterase n=1 Tax=Helicobacter cinaedi TaxID=213 RepID=A0A377JUR4_9HELI|nr:metallophosphoesterase [Helicobacter cinaedi]STP11604.1 metallophosphoesterase [Helicobacter cinaedi]